MMNTDKVTVYTVIGRAEAGQDLINMFTSYFSARLEMKRYADRSDILSAEIYEETIGISGRKMVGLIDKVLGSSIFV